MKLTILTIALSALFNFALQNAYAEIPCEDDPRCSAPPMNEDDHLCYEFGVFLRESISESEFLAVLSHNGVLCQTWNGQSLEDANPLDIQSPEVSVSGGTAENGMCPIGIKNSKLDKSYWCDIPFDAIPKEMPERGTRKNTEPRVKGFLDQ